MAKQRLTLDRFFKKSLAKAAYNIATGYLSVEFPDKPSVEVRSALKQRGFRYKPRGKRWSAKWSVHREDHLKKLASNIAKINIEPNWQRKAEYAQFQATKHQKISQERGQQFHKQLKAIPFGQPILVGHHSEKSHRSHLKKIDMHLKKSLEHGQMADVYEKRSQRYKRKATGESAGLLYRRIKKIEATERKFKRELEIVNIVKKLGKEKAKKLGFYAPDEKWVLRNLEKTQERLKIERGKYKASGGIAIDKLKLKKGDMVRTSYGTAQVARVNPKTVTVKFRRQGSDWHLKVDKSQILGRAK